MITFGKRTNYIKSGTTEGKNEKDLYIHNYFDTAHSLRSVPDSGDA